MLTFIIGIIIASAFPAILVFAQELMPGRVGMVSGLFFGLAFGMAGTGAAVLAKTGRSVLHRTCLIAGAHFCARAGFAEAFPPDIGR